MKLGVRRIIGELRRPPVLVGGGFVLIAAGIAANALFWQPGRHPAPLFATRDAPASPSVPSADPEILALQTALKESGHYAGPLDGVRGPQTERALRAFEAETGGTPRPHADADALASLLVEVAGPPGASPTPSVPPDPRVAAVQSALSRAAYGPLRADGVIGPQTRAAIERFQGDHGLAVTGAVDEALVAELKEAGALEAD